MTHLSASPHQAIYRRWRAQTFSAIVGQEAVVETLRNAVRTGRVSHAILFVGPRGTGKTSLARILAKALNCTNLQDGDPCDTCPACDSIREGRAIDLVEIDAASNRGIDAIRDLRERINYAPTDLRRKVYILDEAHQITKDAWNALLKSLEEPPEFVTFMFASTHPQEFPPAILSRLQRFDVRRLTVPEIEGKLTRILDVDGRQAEPAAVALIARLAAGGMRDAESMLDQLLSSTDGTLDEARVRDLLGLADVEAVAGFVDALVGGDAAVGIRVLDALEERGRDLRVFLDQVVLALRDRLRGAAGGQVQIVSALAAAARRLAAIDPSRAGIGGLRLQLEVALFAADASAAVSVMPAAPSVMAAAPSVSVPAPAPGRHAETDGAAARSTRAKTPAASRATDVPAAAQPVDARATTQPAAVPAATQPPDVAAATEPPAATAAIAPAEPASAPPEGPPAAASPADLPAAASERTPSANTMAVESADAAARDMPAAPGDPDVARLRDGWAQVVASVSPAVRAVISECRPLAVDGNVVTLGFPESKPFLKDHAERKRRDLESAVGRFLGREVAVTCVATNLELVPPVAADPDAAFLMAEARRIFADDLADVGEIG